MAAVFGSTNWRHTIDLRAFAALVQQLRAVQKTGGSGYKTPADGKQALALEQKVDSAVARIMALPS